MSSPTAGSGIDAKPIAKPPSKVVMRWAGGHRFDIGREGGPAITLDSDAQAGPSPVDGLLASLVACVSTDIVDILAKRRTPVEDLSIQVEGARAAAVPARITHVMMRIHVKGAGIERIHAERAIDLAVTKYCSVRNTLDPELPVEWELELG